MSTSHAEARSVVAMMNNLANWVSGGLERGKMPPEFLQYLETLEPGVQEAYWDKVVESMVGMAPMEIKEVTVPLTNYKVDEYLWTRPARSRFDLPPCPISLYSSYMDRDILPIESTGGSMIKFRMVRYWKPTTRASVHAWFDDVGFVHPSFVEIISFMFWLRNLSSGQFPHRWITDKTKIGFPRRPNFTGRGFDYWINCEEPSRGKYEFSDFPKEIIQPCDIPFRYGMPYHFFLAVKKA